MHKLSTRIALLAVVGTMTAVSPVLAAPQNNGPRHGNNGIDCSLAANADNPFCVQINNRANGKYDSNGGANGGGSNANDNAGQTNNSNPAPDNPGDNSRIHRGGNQGGNAQQHPPGNMSGPPHGFDFSRHDRDRFHQQFRGFNFGFFAAPTFSLHVGVTVPRSFDLKPVPRSIYRNYPDFRGYLYFVTRHGDVVIVSPRSHRIVAII